MQKPNWNTRVVVRRAPDQLTVYVRNHQFAVGAPLHFDHEYSEVTALEYVVGALSADLVGCLISAARRHRVHLENIEAAASSELNNALTYLGVVGESGHPGLERVQITTYVRTSARAEDLNVIWEEVLERSPLVQTFKAAVSLDLQLRRL